MDIIIRKEKPSDIERIHEVTVAAFIKAPHTDHTEQFIVQALRNSGALTISLIAEVAGKIIGHVAASPISISDGSDNWYGLGPISVDSSEQGKGIGSKLILTALDELKSLNANGCVVLGDPDFYQRFGFKPFVGLILPNVPAEYFQAILLRGIGPRGQVTYHESFSAKK